MTRSRGLRTVWPGGLLAGLLLVACGSGGTAVDELVNVAGSPAAGSSGSSGQSGAGTGGTSGAAGAGGEPAKTCADVSCGDHTSCDAATLACRCDPGFVKEGTACVPIACEFDTDCDDGDRCNGVEVCDVQANQCKAGEPFVCPAQRACVMQADKPVCACVSGTYESASGECLPACDVPLAPVLSVIADAEVLSFTVAGDLPVEVAILPAEASPSSAVYLPTSKLSLAAHDGKKRVLARVNHPSCTPVVVFDAVYDVRATCAGPALSSDTTAVGVSDPAIVGWATGVESFTIGPGVTDPSFTDPKKALGPSDGVEQVVSLGDGGTITLSFATPIVDGAGWDLAVFENGFGDSFLELAFVEVSSDGKNFARFDSAFRGEGPTSAGYSGDARKVCDLAGSYRASFGTPFDLATLRNQPAVRAGTVDVSAIRYVRVVDIIGDGSTDDSFGRPIFDPYPTVAAAGFDLDAIAVLHTSGSP